MLTLLRRLFIKDYQNLSDPLVRKKHGLLASYLGIVINAILVILKLVAAILLLEVNGVFSAALLADTINNIADISSSVVSLVSFKMAAKPADKEHPFGHARIEYIAGLIISVIVLMLGAQLFYESLLKIIEGELNSYVVSTLVILSISLFLKLLQAYYTYKMSLLLSSPALKATSLDALTDSLSNLAILISAFLSYFLSYDFLDGYMGLLASLFVIFSGFRMLKETSSPLIGQKASKEKIEKITALLKNEKEIVAFHDLMIHDYGPLNSFISLHIEIPETTSLDSAHLIATKLENKIHEYCGANVTIHVDPISVLSNEEKELKNKISETLKQLDPRLRFHDFSCSTDKEKLEVHLDIVEPYEVKLKKEEIDSFLYNALNDSKILLVTNLVHPYEEN